MRFEPAPDVEEKLRKIVSHAEFGHVDVERIACMRSFGSKSRAQARIWSLPRIWQKALGVRAHYVIDVIAQRFDGMTEEEKEKTLIHELLHIPKTFSGALVPHTCFGKRIDSRRVDAIYRAYVKSLNSS